MTRVLKSTNDSFHVRMAKDSAVIFVTIRRWETTAAQWNGLRDSICNDQTITDDTVVYFDYLVTNGDKEGRFFCMKVGKWRKAGFSGGRFDKCEVPEEVRLNADMWFYNNIEVLQRSALTPSMQQRIVRTLAKEYLEVNYRRDMLDACQRLQQVGATEDDIRQWRERIVGELLPWMTGEKNHRTGRQRAV